MTDKEITDAFIQAKDEGFITTFDNNSECNDDCDNCPTSEACLSLRDGETYTTFVSNYKRIYQLLKDK